MARKGRELADITVIAVAACLAAVAAPCALFQGWTLVSFLIWLAAARWWHRWAEAAWGSSPAGLAVDRACWVGAMAHLWLGLGLSELDVPGWGFIWASAGLFWLAGFQALRPRVDSAKLPAATNLCLALAVLCWPAVGVAVGIAAEETGSGVGLGFLFAFSAVCLVGPVWAIQEPKGRGAKAAEGSLAEDLALLWVAALPERAGAGAVEASPLSGYEFSAETARAAAGEAPAAGHAPVDKPTLVESGGFRVDAEKALEKLSRFRSPDPLEFAVGFFRAAVAAGPPRVDIARADGGLEFRFGGRPLDSAALADPLGALLTTGLSGAERELSTGLLGALALPHCRVFVASGEGERRRRLRAAPKGAAPGEARDPGVGTYVAIRWRGGGRDAALDVLRRRAGMLEVPWAIDGELQPPGPAAVGPSGWRKSVGRQPALWLAPRRDPRGASRLRLYRLGTLIEDVEDEELAPSPVEACVRDDAFTLDLSQTRVVRDGRFADARNLVRDHYGKFRSWLQDQDEERWPKLQRAADKRRLWNGLRRAVGWPSKAHVEKDAWDRSVRQWLAAIPGT